MSVNLPKRQRGMTFISWLLVLGIAGIFATIALTLIPIYIEHYSVKHVLAQFENDGDLAKKSTGQLRELMKKRLKINGVYDFDVQENLKVERDKGRVTVRVLYEVRRPVMGNVDLIVHFDDAITR
jgi:Tfp pilus assembly major pilin PilA